MINDIRRIYTLPPAHDCYEWVRALVFTPEQEYGTRTDAWTGFLDVVCCGLGAVARNELRSPFL